MTSGPHVMYVCHPFQIFRSTADFAGATALFNRVTSVPPEWLALRDLVVAKRKPRPMFVQASGRRYYWHCPLC